MSWTHDWTADVLTDVLLQERCSRCGLFRWRAPGEPDWWFGDGSGGTWERREQAQACDAMAERSSGD
jgi:hypothetical protein